MVINKNMQTAENTFLKFIDFIDVSNWSVQYLKWTAFSYNKNFELISIWDFLTRNKTWINIEDWKEYKRVTIKMNNKWVHLRDTERWENIWTKKQFVVNKWQFLLSKIDARWGAFWVIPDEVDWAIITGNFWTFDVDYSKVNPHFLSNLVTTKEFLLFCENASNWTTNRHYLQEDLFLNVKIPLPSLSEQNRIIENYNQNYEKAEKAEKRVLEAEKEIESYLMEELGIEVDEKEEKKKGLQFVDFKNIVEWWIDKIIWLWNIESKNFEVTSLERNIELFEDIKRWKSPKYSDKSDKIILNQKCNRWDNIDLQFWKTVDEKWLENIDNSLLTKEWDILINSTWEWTIWRASLIRKWFEWLLFDSHLLLLRLNKEKVNSDFFTIFFNGKLWQEQVDNIKSAQATKQTELWVWNLKKILFPLPPLPIQDKIVKHIWELKEEIKSLKSLVLELRKGAKEKFEGEIFS